MTTHAFMAEAAIPFVAEPALRNLLQSHAAEVIAGAHYPDGGYAASSYPGGDYGEVSHWERFVNGYTRALRGRADCAPLTSPSGPCAAQVAHLMGVAAHGIGDERWDWLFEPKMADFGESPVHPGYTLFSEAGLPGAAELASLPPGSLINTPEFAMDNIGLVEFDRFRKPPTTLPPVTDLLAAYHEIGRDDITGDGILAGNTAILAAAAGERSGVGAEYPRVKLTMPRVSAQYFTDSGGILDVAQAAASYYSAVWHKLTTGEQPAPVVTAVHPLPDETGVPISWHPVKASPGPVGGGSETRILASLSQALKVGTIGESAFKLYDPDGLPMAMEEGFPKAGPYGYGDGSHTFMLWPREDLRPCSRYTAEVTTALEDYAGGRLAEPYRWSFTTRSANGDACPPRLEPPVQPPVQPPGQPPVPPPPANGPGSGGTTTMSGPAADPSVTAGPQTIQAVPAGGGHGLPAASTIAIRSLSRTFGTGRRLRLLISCLGPGDCSGRVSVVARPGGRTAATIGRRDYRLRRLGSQALTFTLPAVARSALRRTGRLAVAVRAAQNAPSGRPAAATTRNFVLRQRLPR